MATYGRKMGFKMASNLMRTLLTPSTSNFASNSRTLTTAAAAATATSSFVSSEVITSHTAKWMQDTSKKSPMELINEVPPIKVEARIVACEGDSNPALGHPIEFICLDKDEPAICKYCGLRYVQDHGHHRQ
ncbi:NADH dehydrogenase [ubiquinone] iron-sulfur protein 6, mitochondrial-like [Camellia sinensis]|uniref:NADH dehydrogenase [ubiquinone] iron-sulfur protein 6, mitochondrial-like n=1 Tax=Camellia sinensis TaxID=4442 RepID=UPI0010365FD6|nr:NADH dehydrogenase [ubiquinone] iron-sulfur protein 6, mitochondrial-like [Camellia sinensis]